MKQPAKGSNDQVDQFWISSYLVLMIVIGVVLGIVWYVSPLALGFRQWPTQPLTRYWAALLSDASFYIGIPMLLVTPFAALGFNAIGFRRTAVIIPLLSLLSFVACISILLCLLD